MMRTCFSCRRVLLPLALALCLILSLAPRSLAAEVDTPAEEIVEARYTGTSGIYADIEILSSGKAECWGGVSCYPGYTADAVMRLQWKDPYGVWLDWESWEDEGNAVDFYEISTTALPQGRTYRVRVVATTTDANGNWVETIDAVSGSIPYGTTTN